MRLIRIRYLPTLSFLWDPSTRFPGPRTHTHIHVSTVFHEVERPTVLGVFSPRATGGRVEGKLFGIRR